MVVEVEVSLSYILHCSTGKRNSATESYISLLSIHLIAMAGVKAPLLMFAVSCFGCFEDN